MSVERLMMALCALIGAAALFFFGRHVWNSGAPQLEPAGITVSSDVLTIYRASVIDFRKHTLKSRHTTNWCD